MIVNSLMTYIKSGMENVSAEQKNNRLEICRNCEFFEPALTRCGQCGCFLKIKAAWASEKCPLDKWGPELESPHPDISLSAQPPAKDCGCNKNIQ